MGGIPIWQLLSLAVTYGPRAYAVYKALEPALIKAWPLVKAMTADGIPEAEAVRKALATGLAPHRMTREEEERWFVRATGEAANPGH